jgi:hypothetical protein
MKSVGILPENNFCLKITDIDDHVLLVLRSYSKENTCTWVETLSVRKGEGWRGGGSRREGDGGGGGGGEKERRRGGVEEERRSGGEEERRRGGQDERGD